VSFRNCSVVRTGLREYQCSVDRTRNAATHAADTRRNGFERVCEGDLARFDISFRSIAAPPGTWLSRQ